MATISSAGIGSGLDVNSIVTQLVAVEKAPLQNMQKEASAFQDRLSAYGKIQSYTSALRDAAAKLTKATTWGDTSATSADSTIASATTDTTAVAGSYSLTVQQLASAQTLASAASPASVAVGAGVIHIDLGTWAAGQTGFTPKSGSTTADVTILSTDTLADVRDKINAAKSGVMASIVNDSSGSRLVLRSSETGAGSAFRVTTTDADGTDGNSTGLSSLAYNPAAGINSLSRTQTATDALANVNGLSVTSASNVMSGVVEGLTIKLSKVSATPVEIAVTSNSDSIKTAITGFTDAYNNLSKYLADQTKYDSATKTGAILQGDSGTNALRSGMRNIIGDTSGVSGLYHRMADIGIQAGVDGTLTVDSTKLTTALGKLSDVKALFANKDFSDTKNNGFATRLQTWSDTLLSFDGSLTTRSDSLKRMLDANTKKQEDFNTRMTSVEARLRAQYGALDTKMATLNGLSSYMTQQITNMNKTSN
jgi:flagellar hook-associated protein 2